MTRTLEQVRIALAALQANWFRAMLTALGVVIGVASLVAVTAVSAGAQKEVADSIRRLGANVVLVDGEFITIGTGQSTTERTITPDDVAAIAKLPTVDAVLERLVADAVPGDVVVTMSSGSFSGLPQRLAKALAERAASPAPGGAAGGAEVG